MEGNSLVKEITPEEVKTIDPFEISYIAMKDGSIIMVIEKNDKIENNFTLLKKKNEQNSPDFNLKGKKYISYINKKNENLQKENEEDYNVYYSKNTNINIINNKSELNNKKENNEENINNFSFYSNDDIHRNYINQKEKSRNNKIEFEYINKNENISNKESKINEEKRLINNNNIDFISINNNKENKNPYYVIKRKYYFYKKSNENNNKSIKENIKNLNKTYSYNISPKKQNNLYIVKNNNTNKDNISINYSNYSINNNRNSNYIRMQDSKHKKSNTNLYCTCPYIYNRNGSSEINSSIYNNNNHNNNYYFYDINHKPKFDNFDINEYSFKKYENHSFLSRKADDDLNLEKGNIQFRSKTPLYSIKDLKRNTKNNKKFNKNNLELKKCLSKDNHKYYERKEFRAQKQSKSKYIKMKDFNGKTIHIFENK